MKLTEVIEALRLQSTQSMIASELSRRNPRNWVIEKTLNDLEDNASKGAGKETQADLAASIGTAVKAAVSDALKGAK